MPDPNDTPTHVGSATTSPGGFDMEIVNNLNGGRDGSQPTMSSLEITDLLGTRHDSVRRTIERLAEKGVISLPPLVEVKIQRERRDETTMAFMFSGERGKRDSIIVVAQLSPEFTARLVDRWQELEVKPVFNPSNVSRLDMARMLLDAETDLAAEKARSTMLEHQVHEAAPKTEFYDRFASADGLYGIQNAARVLGRKPNKFSQWLKEEYLFYQGGSLVPRARYRGMGIFEVKSEMVDDKARYRTWITPKGLQYFAKKVEAAPVPLAA